ncbi:phosphatidylglycerophosphatase and protein-tyrosine phosphatase 1 isoform X3 [Malaclemys terrapin pileata]|uniref:phosphatidylglycerophosphatase and protein-tyrosine phosphatase 1 isoform X3 n=1 Tax=Malaclemys terrapin pileata TaxID=2991368 RepID=UPI0023A8FACC|nr:phosphatidylglycerophosphatase and protein-tyrosine phosphatase 1 isoform X3 [Malaclemys terrapin pileata]
MGVAVALGSGAARLFFYPSLLYTLVRERLPGSQRPWFHRIDRAVLLGALPLRARSRRLVEEENVRGVLTLNEEYETRFLCCSAQFSHSGFKSLCCLSEDHELFALHAHSLHLPTRQLYQWSPQEAIEAIARIRPHILVRPRQVQVLERFHRNVIAEAAAESQQELPETLHQLPTTSTSS